jgi:hypothetical protein
MLADVLSLLIPAPEQQGAELVMTVFANHWLILQQAVF